MSATFRIRDRDMSVLVDLLDDVEKGVMDLRPAWHKLRSRWRSKVSRDWGSARWSPLSARYARQTGHSQATLVNTGAMKQAVLQPETFEADRDSLLMGVRYGQGRSLAYYAYFHQTGRHVPKRPVWKRLSAAEQREWGQVVMDQITKPFRT